MSNFKSQSGMLPSLRKAAVSAVAKLLKDTSAQQMELENRPGLWVVRSDSDIARGVKPFAPFVHKDINYILFEEEQTAS